MSEGVVHQWVRFFKSGGTNIHDWGSNDRASIVSGELIQKIDIRVCENH